MIVILIKGFNERRDNQKIFYLVLVKHTKKESFPLSLLFFFVLPFFALLMPRFLLSRRALATRKNLIWSSTSLPKILINLVVEFHGWHLLERPSSQLRRISLSGCVWHPGSQLVAESLRKEYIRMIYCSETLPLYQDMTSIPQKHHDTQREISTCLGKLRSEVCFFLQRCF